MPGQTLVSLFNQLSEEESLLLIYRLAINIDCRWYDSTGTLKEIILNPDNNDLLYREGEEELYYEQHSQFFEEMDARGSTSVYFSVRRDGAYPDWPIWMAVNEKNFASAVAGIRALAKNARSVDLFIRQYFDLEH